MLMRLVRARAKPGRWPQLEQDFRAKQPALKDVQGLRARWLFGDLDDCEAGFVVALWDREADAVAFEQSVESSRLLDHPLPGEFELHTCEIRSVWLATDRR